MIDSVHCPKQVDLMIVLLTHWGLHIEHYLSLACLPRVFAFSPCGWLTIFLTFSSYLFQLLDLHLLNFCCRIPGDGLIDFNEFLEMMETRTRSRSKDAEMRALFQAFDKDGSGYIDKNELKATMNQVGMEVTDRDVDTMMKASGVASKDRIFYEGEFTSFSLSLYFSLILFLYLSCFFLSDFIVPFYINKNT